MSLAVLEQEKLWLTDKIKHSDDEFKKYNDVIKKLEDKIVELKKKSGIYSLTVKPSE